MKLYSLKKIFIILFCSLLCIHTLHSSTAGDRNANPTYIRTPKVYEIPYALPTQHAPSMPAAPTHSPMMLRPIIQPTQLTPHVDAHRTYLTDTELLKMQQAAQQAAREKEIAGYTHMYGSSDTYGGFEPR